MKIRLILILSLIVNFPAFTQEIAHDYISLQEQFVIVKDGNRDSKIEGSPYFEDEFLPGQISENGKQILSGFFRYNVVKDQIEIKINKKDKDVFILPRLKTYQYDLNKYSYSLKKFSTQDGELLLGYVVEYFDKGSVVFLDKPSVKVRPGEKAETSYGKNRPSRYRIRNRYYLGFKDKPLQEIKIRERDVDDQFKNSVQMENYFKSHKIKHIEDIVKMLEYHQSIVSND